MSPADPAAAPVAVPAPPSPYPPQWYRASETQGDPPSPIVTVAAVGHPASNTTSRNNPTRNSGLKDWTAIGSLLREPSRGSAARPWRPRHRGLARALSTGLRLYCPYHSLSAATKGRCQPSDSPVKRSHEDCPAGCHCLGRRTQSNKSTALERAASHAPHRAGFSCDGRIDLRCEPGRSYCSYSRGHFGGSRVLGLTASNEPT